MLVDNNALPVLSKDIIARNDENGILLFQVHTDEMYFVPFSAYYSFIVKCDGSQTYEEICANIGCRSSNTEEKGYIDGFMQELIKREIIALW